MRPMMKYAPFEPSFGVDVLDRLMSFAMDNESHGVVLNRVMDVYERSLMTPAQIDQASPSEVSEAEWVIERALNVLHGIEMVDE